jgi:uncharacterized protein
VVLYQNLDGTQEQGLSRKPMANLQSVVLAWNDKWRVRIEDLLKFQLTDADGAHNLAHVQRVVTNAIRLMQLEDAEPKVVLPAAWLHDCVLVRKDSPQRNLASRLAAEKAREFLKEMDYHQNYILAITHAIEAHSFSAGINPETIEAKVVQDADRIDALGAFGIARCFLTAGVMQAELCSPVDPWAKNRPLDDCRYAVDHFFQKLLKLPTQMQTEGGRKLANERAQVLVDFLQQMAAEADWDCAGIKLDLNDY